MDLVSFFLDSNNPKLALVVVATNESINLRYQAFLGTHKTRGRQPVLTNPGSNYFSSGHLVDMLGNLAEQLKPLVESLRHIPEGPQKALARARNS